MFQKKLKFGIVGPFQAGKSLFINCLLSRPIATVGDGTATTHVTVSYLYSNSEEYIEYRSLEQWSKLSIDEFNRIDTAENLSEVKVYLKHDLLKEYTIIDIPGLGNDNTDNAKAEEAIKTLDYAILLTSNEKEITTLSDDYQSFILLKKYSIPYYYIVNCTKSDKWYPNTEHNQSRYIKNRVLFQSFKPIVYPHQENEPIIVNLIWYWLYSQGRNAITSKYEYLLKKYGLFKSDLDPRKIKLHSNFHLIEEIFSMDNRAYLELKKEFKEQLAKLKEELCPVGTIQVFAFNRIPKGWMICDGSKLDPTVHYELFNAIGTTFGGDGKNYFYLPDLRGRFVRGWDSIGKIDKNRKFGSYQDDSLQNHNHALSCASRHTSYGGSHTHDFYTNFYSVCGIGTTGVSHVENGYTSNSAYTKKSVCSEGAHSHELPSMNVENVQNCRSDNETRPNNCALMYCIRYTDIVDSTFVGHVSESPKADQNIKPNSNIHDDIVFNDVNQQEIRYQITIHDFPKNEKARIQYILLKYLRVNPLKILKFTPSTIVRTLSNPTEIRNKLEMCGAWVTISPIPNAPDL